MGVPNVYSEALKKNREILAFGLLAVPALIFIVGLSLLFKDSAGFSSGAPGFATKAALFGDVFLNPVVAISVAVAAALVTWGDRTRNARTVVLVALGLGGACLLLGLVCMLAALGSDNGLGIGTVVGTGKVTGLLYSLALLIFVGIALLYVALAFRGLPAAHPAQPAWGQPPAWGQQPGQPAWGQQPDQQWTSDQQAWGAPAPGGWDQHAGQQPVSTWGPQPGQPPAPGWAPHPGQPAGPGWGPPGPPAPPGAGQPGQSWGQPGPGWGQPGPGPGPAGPGPGRPAAPSYPDEPVDPDDQAAPPDPASPAEPAPPAQPAAPESEPPPTGGWWQQPDR
jgi:hypothetical protein